MRKETLSFDLRYLVYDVKNLSVRSNSIALTIPQTKFEAIISKGVGGDRFEVKTHASRQILGLGHYNLLFLAPMVMILIFLESQCKEFPKNINFYLLLAHNFGVMLLS